MPRSAARRSTSNSHTRGSSADRRARRRWLVDHFGDGVFVACRFCWTTLTEDTVSPDRIVLGVDGGTYRRSNIQPACRPCQCIQGGIVGPERRRSQANA